MPGRTVHDIFQSKRTILLTLLTGVFLGFSLNLIAITNPGKPYMPILLTCVAAGVIMGQFMLLTDLRMEEWK